MLAVWQILKYKIFLRKSMKLEELTVRYKVAEFSELSEEQQELLLAAEEKLPKAYNPYSKFYVATALRSKDGQITVTNNTENSSYGLTVCAERIALFVADARELRNFTSMATITKGINFDVLVPSTSCGACRQVIREFAERYEINMELIYSNTKKDIIWITTIEDILPLPFGPGALEISLDEYR